MTGEQRPRVSTSWTFSIRSCSFRCAGIFLAFFIHGLGCFLPWNLLFHSYEVSQSGADPPIKRKIPIICVQLTSEIFLWDGWMELRMKSSLFFCAIESCEFEKNWSISMKFQYFSCCKIFGDDAELYRQHFLSFCALAALLAALVATGTSLFIGFQ